jgi:hypothetical protein
MGRWGWYHWRVFLRYMYINLKYVLLWFLYRNWGEAMLMWDLCWNWVFGCCSKHFWSYLWALGYRIIILSNRGSELASLSNLVQNSFVINYDYMTIYDHKTHEPNTSLQLSSYILIHPDTVPSWMLEKVILTLVLRWSTTQAQLLTQDSQRGLKVNKLEEDYMSSLCGLAFGWTRYIKHQVRMVLTR